MKIFILFCLFFSSFSSYSLVYESEVIGGVTYQRNWVGAYKTEKLSINNLLNIIKKSKVGEGIIEMAQKKANEQGGELLSFIKIGSGSLTDTTLIRRFSIDSPDEISFETKSTIYINKSLKLEDAVLDLAHELTHFIFREPFNPYLNNFTLTSFIRSTIEGNGGEAHALLNECRVLKDLFPHLLGKRNNCGEILGADEHFSREVAVEKFYQVGHLYSAFKNTLKKNGIRSEFLLVSDKKAAFISSAYGLPYPVAAYKEYTTVLERVCDNDKKRLVLLRQNRTPASENSFLKKWNEFEHRCEKFI